MRDFALDAFRAFFGTRGAFVGLLVRDAADRRDALGLALQSNLAVEFGMSDDEVAWLNLWSTIVRRAAGGRRLAVRSVRAASHAGRLPRG